jgi:dihydrofolate reductase
VSKVRINAFSISADGYGAGPDQSLDNPLGRGGMALHSWALPTKTFQQTLFGKTGGTTGVDETFAARGFSNLGAWILGRNMFAPSRGPWPDDGWKGWWGDTPPYHTPVFVLTHHARAPIEMNGGTTFHFVTEGIHAALDRAREAANGKDIRVGGGVSVVRQFLQARLVDQAHFAIAPAVLGSGEHVFADMNLRALGYDTVEHAASDAALHIVLAKAT